MQPRKMAKPSRSIKVANRWKVWAKQISVLRWQRIVGRAGSPRRGDQIPGPRSLRPWCSRCTAFSRVGNRSSWSHDEGTKPASGPHRGYALTFAPIYPKPHSRSFSSSSPTSRSLVVWTRLLKTASPPFFPFLPPSLPLSFLLTRASLNIADALKTFWRFFHSSTQYTYIGTRFFLFVERWFSFAFC